MTQPMTLEKFDKLGKRDFSNGAVLDEIAAALKEREQLLCATATPVVPIPRWPQMRRGTRDGEHWTAVRFDHDEKYPWTICVHNRPEDVDAFDSATDEEMDTKYPASESYDHSFAIQKEAP